MGLDARDGCVRLIPDLSDRGVARSRDITSSFGFSSRHASDTLPTLSRRAGTAFFTPEGTLASAEFLTLTLPREG